MQLQLKQLRTIEQHWGGGKVDNKNPKDVIDECERFFRSPFFNSLTNIDGEYFITNIRKEF